MIPSGHYTAALAIPYIQSQSFAFFEKHFASPDRASAKTSRVVRTKAH
jgi:hypothetical protein